MALLLGSLLAITSDQPVPECGWAAQAGTWGGFGQCSGILVHPQVALYAPGCFDDGDSVRFVFGGSATGPAMYEVTAPAENCIRDGGLGACVFNAPLPITPTPIASGCERALLTEGTPLTIVGMGAKEQGIPNGQKFSGDVTVSDTLVGAFNVDGEHAPCTGDAGSPAFMELPDGTWRTVGLASTSTCDNPSVYLDLATYVDWLEEQTGFDLSPCHDDGSPDPGPDCEGFVVGTDPAGATWVNSCADAPSGGDGGVCSGDADPPSVSIASHADGEELGDGPAELTIAIDADDADGLGIRDVRLEIDGEVLDVVLDEPPFELPLTLPDGAWTISALARDWGGNESASDAITLYVGQPAPEGDTGSVDDGGSSDGGDVDPETTGEDAQDDPSGDGTGGSNPGADAEAESPFGCSVSAHGRAGAPWLAVVLLWRRRLSRRRAGCP